MAKQENFGGLEAELNSQAFRDKLEKSVRALAAKYEREAEEFYQVLQHREELLKSLEKQKAERKSALRDKYEETAKLASQVKELNETYSKKLDALELEEQVLREQIERHRIDHVKIYISKMSQFYTQTLRLEEDFEIEQQAWQERILKSKKELEELEHTLKVETDLSEQLNQKEEEIKKLEQELEQQEKEYRGRLLKIEEQLSLVKAQTRKQEEEMVNQFEQKLVELDRANEELVYSIIAGLEDKIEKERVKLRKELENKE